MTTETLVRGATRRRARSRKTDIGGPRIIPLFFYVALVIAVFFAMIYFRIALDRSAFELDRLEDEITVEESRQLDLRLEIAELQNPLRITNEAERIGLVHPDEHIALVVTGRAEPAAPLPQPEVVRALPEVRP